MCGRDWSSDVCSSDLTLPYPLSLSDFSVSPTLSLAPCPHSLPCPLSPLSPLPPVPTLSFLILSLTPSPYPLSTSLHLPCFLSQPNSSPLVSSASLLSQTCNIVSQTHQTSHSVAAGRTPPVFCSVPIPHRHLQFCSEIEQHHSDSDLQTVPCVCR